MTTMDGAVRRSTSMSKNFQNSFSLSMMKNVFDDENFNAQFVFFVGSSKKKTLLRLTCPIISIETKKNLFRLVISSKEFFFCGKKILDIERKLTEYSDMIRIEIDSKFLEISLFNGDSFDDVWKRFAASKGRDSWTRF